MAGTRDQDVSKPVLASASSPDSPLERALRRLGSMIEARLPLNKGGGLAYVS
jgi:hypothetical protein